MLDKVRIAPSLLSADCANLGAATQALTKAGADWIHLDVMDNHYVPNLTFGPMICAALKPYTDLPIDVHLMISPVDDLAVAFAKAGANIISFHPEATLHPQRSAQIIKNAGCKVGLVLNPATPLHYLDFLLDDIDVVLLMSVNPGFGGQRFIPQVLPKIAQTRQILDAYQARSNRAIDLQVDGGVTCDNAAEIRAAGANVLVAGSAIFNAEQTFQETIDKLRGKWPK